MKNNTYFIYRIKETGEVVYTEKTSFDCGHYFGRITICAASFCGGKFKEYDKIETVLSKEEYNLFLNVAKEIEALGYGIEKGSDKYLKGLELLESIDFIYEKLEGQENRDFIEEIKEEDRAYLEREYGLDSEDIEEIFENSSNEYFDKGIIARVYSDLEEFIEDYVEEEVLYIIVGEDWQKRIMERHFDYEGFARELLEEDERFIELSNGVIMEYYL